MSCSNLNLFFINFARIETLYLNKLPKTIECSYFHSKEGEEISIFGAKHIIHIYSQYFPYKQSNAGLLILQSTPIAIILLSSFAYNIFQRNCTSFGRIKLIISELIA